MLTATNGPPARGLRRWAARANSSLPVPGSPRTRIGRDERAAFSRSRNSVSTAGSRVMMPSSAHRRRSRSCSASPSCTCPASAARNSRSSACSRLRVWFSCARASASCCRSASAAWSNSRSAPVERATAARAASRSSSSASTVDSWRTSASRIPSTSPSRPRRRWAESNWFHSRAPAQATTTAASGRNIGRTMPINDRDSGTLAI